MQRERCTQRHTMHLPSMPPPSPFWAALSTCFLFWEEIHFTLGYSLLKKVPDAFSFFPPLLFEKSSVGISFLEATFPLQLWHEIKLIFGVVRQRQWRQRGVDVNSITIHLFPHLERSMAVWVIPSSGGKQHGVPATDDYVSLHGYGQIVRRCMLPTCWGQEIISFSG